jgi:hypothetical protein
VTACIGQPLSWLTLERHALAELEGAAAAAAREHLTACPACTAALDSIQADRRPLPALPALPVPTASGTGRMARDDVAAATVVSLDDARRRRRTRWAGAGVAAAVAAAALLLLLVRPQGGAGVAEPTARVRVKGAGVVSLGLVRDRDGVVSFDPPEVADRDRWKVQLTCAPGGGAWVDVLVYQRGEPVAVALPPQRFACGNDIVIPGAFRITGGAATICARLAPDQLTAVAPPPSPGAGMACRSVAAAP